MTFEALKDIRGKWEAFYTKSSKEATPLLCVVRTSWRRSLGWPVRTAMWIGSRWNHYRFAKIFSIRNHVKSKISWLVGSGSQRQTWGSKQQHPKLEEHGPRNDCLAGSICILQFEWLFNELFGFLLFKVNHLLSDVGVLQIGRYICIYIYTGKGQKSHQPLGMIETCLSALDR